MSISPETLINIGIVIKTIIEEINAYKQLNTIINEQLSSYVHSLELLNNSVSKINSLFINGIPVEHLLKMSLLDNLKIKINNFSETLKKINIYKNNNFLSKCFNAICISPSKMITKIEMAFEEINKIIGEIIKLEDTILGSAIRIEHPFLQMVWLLIGSNQLGDSYIDANLFIQAMITLLKKQEGIYFNDKEERYYVELITSFVNHLDNIAGTNMDNKISIFELNQIKPNENNTKSVKQLLENEFNNIVTHKNETTKNVSRKRFNTLYSLRASIEKPIMCFPDISPKNNILKNNFMNNNIDNVSNSSNRSNRSQLKPLDFLPNISVN